MTQKIVVNRCWGGFGLSHDAVLRYAELAGFKLYSFMEKRDANGNLDWHHFQPYDEVLAKKTFSIIHYSKQPLNSDGTYVEDSYFSALDFSRDDPILVQVVEEMGKKASGKLSSLAIVEIPDGVKWVIDDYDGMETVEEEHRSW